VADNEDNNRGPGRPKKPPSERRTESLGVSLSPKEKQNLEELAEAAGLSQSELVRRRTLGKKVSPQATRAAQEQLRTVVVDLQSLTRQAREKGATDLAETAQKIFDKGRDLLKQFSTQ
jgi:ribosome-binding protein aMBF1 (putative translation factor)